MVQRSLFGDDAPEQPDEGTVPFDNLDAAQAARGL